MALEENTDRDSDDEEFMDKVNVYLSSRESIDSSSMALEGILRRNSSLKSVKFAMDEAELQDAALDDDRSRQELLSKIARLTEMLKEAEEQITSEKDKRKKKEKNLMKLAKELKKRNAQRESDLERMEELDEKKKYLEHHWVLAQKELDQEKILRQKLQNATKEDGERTIKDGIEKYSNAVKEHEERIKDLKQAHAKQCDELCREVLKANLEADRFHSQLNGGDSPPRKTRLFSDGREEKSEGAPLVLIVVAMILAVVAFAGYKVNMFTMDAVCAPIMPGRSLGSADAGSSFESPWWAPSEYKAQAFEHVCSKELPPTVLEWLPDGKENKAVLTSEGKVVFTKRGAVTAEAFGDRLRIWNKKGLAEEHLSLWSI